MDGHIKKINLYLKKLSIHPLKIVINFPSPSCCPPFLQFFLITHSSRLFFITIDFISIKTIVWHSWREKNFNYKKKLFSLSHDGKCAYFFSDILLHIFPFHKRHSHSWWIWSSREEMKKWFEMLLGRCGKIWMRQQGRFLLT